MEESSNGKVEEILREESGVKEKEVVNSNDDSGAVTVTVVDGKSESVDENHDGGDSSPQVVDSGDFEEEKAVAVSFVDSVKHEVPESEQFNVGEKVSAIETVEVPEDVTELKTEGTEEVSNETSKEDVTELKPEGTEEVSNEISFDGLPPSDGEVIEEVKLPSSEEDGEASVPVAITEEESKVIEASTGDSSYAVDVESREKVEEFLQELANSGNVENTTDANQIANKPEISESNGNQPIISLSQRTAQPTSWRSCCGLFEILRGSDR